MNGRLLLSRECTSIYRYVSVRALFVIASPVTCASFSPALLSPRRFASQAAVSASVRYAALVSGLAGLFAPLRSGRRHSGRGLAAPRLR